MQIQQATTLGEIHAHFSKKAIAFDLHVCQACPGSAAEERGSNQIEWIGALERLNGTSKGDIIEVKDSLEASFSFPCDTIVFVEDKSVRWSGKGRNFTMRFFADDPMKIADPSSEKPGPQG